MVEETAADSQFDAWQSLAAWLRDGRLERGLSVADVARTTKIQARILEDLEAGHPEELPADVFVRGFVRNYARCVGLSEAEALARYAACGRDVGPVASPAATAVAELYAPVARKSRMSTVVPVAPGSSAAEVHAHGGQTIRRAATSPGISMEPSRRAATSPGIATGISMEPSRRAATSPGISTGIAMEPSRRAATSPGIATGISMEPSRRAPSVVMAAVAEPVEGWPVPSRNGRVEVVAHEPAPVAEAAELDAASSTKGTVSPSKKRRARKRREERAARQRAQTVRPVDELEAYESADGSTSQPDHPTNTAHETSATTYAAVEPVVIAGPASDDRQPDVRDARDATAESIGLAMGKALSAAPAIEAAHAVDADEPREVWIPRRPATPRPAVGLAGPSLVIDDADPESASRTQEVRATEHGAREGRDPTRRTFLPPILLESQDRANRQGGLTLAVIILLIAATLTLSYLMRRPSSGGGGMTSIESSPTLVG